MSRGEIEWQRRQIEILNQRGMAVTRAMNRAAANPSECALVQVSLPLAILLGGSQDMPVVWPVTFHRADYRVDLIPLSGMVGRGTLAVVDGSQTTTGCTARVTAGLALAIGAQFLAHASC